MDKLKPDYVFGNGTLGVCYLELYGDPCVEIYPLIEGCKGVVGQDVKKEHTPKGFEYSLLESGVTLQFPTKEQAMLVSDVLVNGESEVKALQKKLAIAKEALEEITRKGGKSDSGTWAEIAMLMDKAAHEALAKLKQEDK